MRRVQERDVSFIGAERMRLQQLLDGKISNQKRKEINRKLNILSAFNVIETFKPHTELWDFSLPSHQKRIITRINDNKHPMNKCIFKIKIWILIGFSLELINWGFFSRWEWRYHNALEHFNFRWDSFICFPRKNCPKGELSWPINNNSKQRTITITDDVLTFEFGRT